MNAFRANVVMAGIDKSHGLWKSRQLRDVILSDHQLLEFRKTQKRLVGDGCDFIGRKINPLEFA